MNRKILPPTYYLEHFLEFLEQLETASRHLLFEEHRLFIQRFYQLNTDSQCLLVRCISRKGHFFHLESLNYAEIIDQPMALRQLKAAGFVASIRVSSVKSLIKGLTKPQLQQLIPLCSTANTPSKSASKLRWMTFFLAPQQVKVLEAQAHSLNYIELQHLGVIEYLLFLFFGQLDVGLSQFSLRDLGILQTRKSIKSPIARFETSAEAYSAFLYGRLRRDVKSWSQEACLLAASQFFSLPEAKGVQAKMSRSRYCWSLAKAVYGAHPSMAMPIFSSSDEPKAISSWLRFEYQQGKRASVAKRLRAILENPPCEESLLLAESYERRWYGAKTASPLTRLLDASKSSIPLEDAWKGSVEAGVVAWYQQQGVDAFHAENQLWRFLFATCFWYPIYQHSDLGFVGEFDVRPAFLRDKKRIPRHKSVLLAELDRFQSADDMSRHITAICEEFYDSPNGLFFWHDDLIAVCLRFVQTLPYSALRACLKMMVLHFNSLLDGFPDLLVFDQGAVRFEEIKSPGDQLRRNQLVTLKYLDTCGVPVGVRSTHWAINPNQEYVVVDFETTGGLHNGHHRITEIGMVRVRGEQVVDTWQTLVHPQRRIPHSITQLTGIDDAMVSTAPTFAEICDQILSFLEGAIFVAHNVSFDFGFLKAELQRLDITLAMPKLCTVQLARRYLPGHTSYALGNLTKDLDIPLDTHHRALADARATAEIFLKIQKIRALALA